MKIDFPVPEQYPQLSALWQEAFADSEEFVDGFFCTAHSPSRCRCVIEEGRIIAALYWLDTAYQGQRFAYLYAVAVARDRRGQGVFRRLLADTHSHLALRGYDGILLYPGSEALRESYKKYGYRDCTTVSRFTCTAGTEIAALHRIDRDTYARLRRDRLPADAVVQEDENIAYLEMMAFFYAGEDFLLAASTEGGRLRSPEFLGDPAVAPGILAALGCTEGTFQTPGPDHPYAMFLPLHGSAVAPGYFGLSFHQ